MTHPTPARDPRQATTLSTSSASLCARRNWSCSASGARSAGQSWAASLWRRPPRASSWAQARTGLACASFERRRLAGAWTGTTWIAVYREVRCASRERCCHSTSSRLPNEGIPSFSSTVRTLSPPISKIRRPASRAEGTGLTLTRLGSPRLRTRATVVGTSCAGRLSPLLPSRITAWQVKTEENTKTH